MWLRAGREFNACFKIHWMVSSNQNFFRKLEWTDIVIIIGADEWMKSTVQQHKVICNATIMILGLQTRFKLEIIIMTNNKYDYQHNLVLFNKVLVVCSWKLMHAVLILLNNLLSYEIVLCVLFPSILPRMHSWHGFDEYRLMCPWKDEET